MKNLWLVLAALLVFAAMVMAERDASSTELKETRACWWRPHCYSAISGSQVQHSAERTEVETIKETSIADILALDRKEVLEAGHSAERTEVETIKETSIADILALDRKEVLEAGHQHQEET
ncbi:hypothetical protein JRQ81_018698 [Phrynocephalus forsythii]|uniref:Secreted protein n=1 Tax=Phrynocephalus forsythii TaxID=171643 RepID=A0A9Q0XSE1_9SAUR|nr:hypothetical protein JRQ81_018698 [Phrynocephalus forsythii]